MASPYDAIVKKYAGASTAVAPGMAPPAPAPAAPVDPVRPPVAPVPAPASLADNPYAAVVSKYATSKKQAAFDVGSKATDAAIAENLNPGIFKQIAEVAKGLPGGLVDVGKGLVTHPLESAQSIVLGLMDVGPAIVNGGASILRESYKAIHGKYPTNPLSGKVESTPLPLPGQTFHDYVGGTDPVQAALTEGAKQFGSFELGGGAVKSTFGAATTFPGKIVQGAAGNVLGGQAILPPGTSFTDRAKAAAFDAAFGVAMEGAGAGVRALRGKKVPGAPAEAPVAGTVPPEAPPPGAPPVATEGTIGGRKIQKITPPEAPAIPDVVYQRKPSLGKAPNGEPVLATTEYDSRTGRAIIYYSRSLDSNPALRTTVLDHEVGHVLDKRVNEGRNLSAAIQSPKANAETLQNALGPFAKQTGTTVQEAGTKLAADIEKLSKGIGSTPGEKFANAYAAYKAAPEVALKEAPTFDSFMKHQPTPKRALIETRSVTESGIKRRTVAGKEQIGARTAKLEQVQTTEKPAEPTRALRAKINPKAPGQTLYHGTNAKFDTFDPAKMGTIEKNHAAKNAFFFTDSKATARGYGKNIKEVVANFKNPVTIDAKGKMFGDMRDTVDEAVLAAKKNGNDVVIIKNLSDEKKWGQYKPATHYAVLDIKAVESSSRPPRTDIATKPHRPPPIPLKVRQAAVEHVKAHEPVKAQVDRVAAKTARKIPGAQVEKAPLKSVARIAEKARNDYKGDVSKVKDVARNTITVRSVGDAKRALADLKKSSDVVRVKDSLTGKGEGGYRTILVNIKAPGGKIAEVQITLKSLWDAKIKTGDTLYHEWRTLDAKPNPTKVDLARLQVLKQKMSELYDNAFSNAAKPSGNRDFASSKESRITPSPNSAVAREGRSQSIEPSSKTPTRSLPSAPGFKTTTKLSSQSAKKSTVSIQPTIAQTAEVSKLSTRRIGPPKYEANPTPGTGRIASTGLRTNKGVNTRSFNPSKINAPDEVQALFDTLGKENKNFSSQRLSKGNEDIKDLARLTGLTEAELLKARPGSIANSETVTAARQLVLNKANDLMNTLKGIDVSAASPAQLKAIRDDFLKLVAMQKSVAGFRTEASNVFRSLGLELMPGENATLSELAGLLKQEGLASEGDAAVFAGKVAKQANLSTFDKVREGVLSTWYSSILSGPKTTVRNVLSTGSNIVTEMAAKTANPKQWKEIMPALSGLLRGLKMGAGEARDILAGAPTPTKFMETGGSAARPPTFTGKFATYGKVVESVGRFLNAQDKFLSAGAREMERASLKARGSEISQAVEDAVVRAYGERTVYHGHPTGKFIGGLRDAAQSLRRKYPWAKFVIPFVDTVANVMDRQFDYFPITAALRIKPSILAEQTDRIIKDYGLKEADRAFIEQRLHDQQMGRLFLGTAVSGGAILLASAGRISGNGPKNYSEKQQLQRTGWRPNSIKIGDTWVPYTYLGPLAGIFSMAGNIYDKITYDNAPGKDLTSLFANGLVGWTQTQLNASFLSGVADLFDVATGNLDPNTYITNFAAGLVPIPAAYSQTKDMIFRQQYQTHGFVEKIRQKLGLTEGLQPRLDQFGQPMTADLIYGITPSAENASKVDRFLIANDLIVSIPSASTKYSIPGTQKEKRSLTPEEYTFYVKTSGQQIYQELEKRLPGFANMSADQQKTAVQNLVDRIRTQVRGQVLRGAK